jgi:L-amino acid N-acyltransferase YncA
MKLRFLETPDMPAFRELRLEGLKNHPTSYMHIHDEEKQRPDAYHEGMITQNRVIGAFDDNALVGFAFMSPFGAIKQRHKCQLWGAYVKPEYRDHGIGKDMRLALFEHAKTLGMTHCLSSIVDGNPASLAMHEGVGYEKMYTEKFGLRHRDGSFSDIIHLVKYL